MMKYILAATRTALLSGGLLVLAPWVSGTAQAESIGPMCPGAPEISRQDQIRLDQQIINLDRATRTAYAELPFEELRVDAAQQALGDDPEVLFRWVRDETRWLPYAGALRGADGVMLDRMGSSLDRALLLAALLERAGHEVRLVRAPLGDSGFATLQEVWSQRSAATRPQPELDELAEHEAIIEVAQRYAMQPDELEAIYREQFAVTEQTRERLLEQTRLQTAALRESLTDSTARYVALGGVAVAEHWWVEWRSTQGWVDFDPALPEHEPGERLVESGEFEHYYAEALPEEVFHRLKIQVVAEQSAGGRLHEHVAFEYQIAAADILGRQLQLEMYPLGLPSPQTLLDEDEALAALPGQLLDEQRWLPSLRIGDTLQRQLIVHADGSVEDPNEQTATGRAFSDAASVLGSITIGGQRDEHEITDSELTAVFVRFSVSAPGRDTDTFERSMMDLLGPAQRAAGGGAFAISEALREQRAAALLGTFELLAQNSWLPPSQQAAWRYEALLDNRQASLGVAYAATQADFSFMGATLEARSLRRNELDQLAGLRLAYSPHLERIALTRLNLLGYVSLLDYRDGQLKQREGFDILDNRVDVPTGESVAEIRMAQGVLDTLLEAELLTSEGLSVSNAAAAYRRDLERQNVWRSITDVAALDALDWEPNADLMTHFEQTLAEGALLVMPMVLADTAQPTWWQLDPMTGDVLGYGPDRRGQAVEALLTLLSAADNAMGAVKVVQSLWDCLLTSDNPHCCGRTAAARYAISKMAGKGLGAAAHAQRVNLIIGRSIVHGSTFRMLNEAAIGKVAGTAGNRIGREATNAVGCS